MPRLIPECSGRDARPPAHHALTMRDVDAGNTLFHCLFYTTGGSGSRDPIPSFFLRAVFRAMRCGVDAAETRRFANVACGRVACAKVACAMAADLSGMLRRGCAGRAVCKTLT